MQKKVPKQSALYKQALFSFPSLFLFCYSRAVFTRVPFFDRKAKGPLLCDRKAMRSLLPDVDISLFQVRSVSVIDCLYDGYGNERERRRRSGWGK